MSNWGNYRTIIESQQVEAKVEALKRKYERFASQWEGLKWLVSRMPEEVSLRKVVGDAEYRLAHRTGEAEIGLPDIAAVYTFDDNNVEIIAVEVWDGFQES